MNVLICDDDAWSRAAQGQPQRLHVAISGGQDAVAGPGARDVEGDDGRGLVLGLPSPERLRDGAEPLRGTAERAEALEIRARVARGTEPLGAGLSARRRWRRGRSGRAADPGAQGER